MDLTQQYKLMSKEALEIQDNYNPKIGDYIYLLDKSENPERYFIISDFWPTSIKLIDLNNLQYINRNRNHLLVWIPKQDQLQQIYANWSLDGNLIKASNWYIVVLDDFQDWVLNDNSNNKFGDNYILQFISLEQLWLAFVMLMVYNKTWDNKVNKWEDI
jgi:hypothetical protein